ncbi:MAG: hypothetical protein AAF798_09975, partial [Bacteroidota bacterium]
RNDLVENIRIQAKKDGFNFSKQAIKLLEEGMHLPLADSIASVNDWTKDLIEKRSKNLAELAWAEISPWLFD